MTGIKSNKAFNQHFGKGPPLEKTKVVGANMHQTEPKTESDEEYERRCESVNRDIERQLRDHKERDMMMQAELKDLKE